jgi:hypothetical protein
VILITPPFYINSKSFPIAERGNQRISNSNPLKGKEIMDRFRLISQSTFKALEDVLLKTPSRQREAIDDTSRAILTISIPFANKRKKRKTFFKTVESIISNKTKKFSQSEKNIFRRSLIAKLALDLSVVIEQMDLPESILKLYPEAFNRLSTFLLKNESNTYNLSNDYFDKDIAFVLGVSVPCGALFVDLKSYFLFRSIVRALFRPGNINAIVRFFQVGGFGPWFRIHIDTRYLDDFNEIGYNASYIRIADLLERNHSIRGMFGISWLQDPQLLSISPHLAHIHRQPLERGAFMIRHGTSASDIKLSTLKSKTRRSLYQEGRYVPVSYSLFWPRKDLISWGQSTQ